MKRILYSVMILLGLFSAACNDWLEVSPETEKDKEDILSKEDGYRNVLVGAYIRMKQTSLYGREMVCGTVEKLAQHWDASSKDPFRKYDYRAAEVESAVGSLYNNLYKVIADVNGMLGEIDAHKEVFSKDSYALLKAEALGIRAFCHFDVLRLFGPMPSALSEGAILPYVREVKIVPNSRLDYPDFVAALLADLDEAESLMKDVDPICSHSIRELNNLPSAADKFWGYRQMRMNYYAVCALKARVYLWDGRREEALRYARLVINARDAAGNSMYRLGNSNDCAAQDFTFSSEHIFNLNVNDLSSGIGSGKAYEKSSDDLLDRLYEKGTTDIRFKYMWNEVFDDWNWVYNNYFVKYAQSDKMPQIARNSIPLIRLYEMYLIAMECAPLEQAGEIYSELCGARDIEPVEITTQEELRKVLVLEYNREFYGEGQAFYAYKRLGEKEIIFSQVEGSVETYVIPLPKQENI